MTALHPSAPGGYTPLALAACPDENVLVQLAHGGLESPALRQSLQAHLDGCGTCRQLVAAVAGGSAPLAPSAFAPLASGTTLGRYRIERLIGAGGMGVLYVAHDTRLERRVALKLMHPSQDDEAGKARLWREAQAMARLSHPNVVNVFDLGEYEGQLFLAMELVEGGTLREWLRTPRAPAEVVALLAAAGEGLAAAHRAGVVHRDFKPENVLVSGDGRARVTDFGLSRPGEPRPEQVPALATGPVDLTRTGTMMGTPAYMSPEQLLRQPADARSDQYSFCVTLFEALYGRRPHDGATLDAVRAQVLRGTLARPPGREVPERVWRALERGLSVEPAHRFPSMEALLAALRPAPRARVWPLALGALAALTLVVALARAELQPAAVAPAPAPEPAPAAVAPATPPVEKGLELLMKLGERRTVRVPDVDRIGLRDPKVADAEPGDDGELHIVARAVGATELTVLKRDGKRVAYAIRVLPTPEADLAPASLTVLEGEEATLRIPAMQRLAIGDSAIADVKTIGGEQLLVTGGSAGKTTLLVWTSDGKRRTWLVTVRKKGGPTVSDTVEPTLPR